MTLNTNNFAIASAFTFSLLWIVCSLLVWVFPTMMLEISGDMLHMNISTMGWELSIMGFARGLIGWAGLSGLTGWLLATLYNRRP